jgi:hypothetical protein
MIKVIDIINIEGKARDMPLAVNRWLSNRSLNQQLKGKAPLGEKADVQVIAVFLPQAAWFLWKIWQFYFFAPNAGCRPLIASDAQNDDRDVIGAATLQCRIDQLQAGLGRRFG